MDSDVIRRGYLKLAGEGRLGFASARKRWVLLREKSSRGETRLEIFSSEKAERDGENVKQCVNLMQASHATRAKQRHAFSIELKTNETSEEMLFISESEADADDWVEAVNRQLVRSNALKQGLLSGMSSSLPASARISSPSSNKSKSSMFRVNPQNLHSKLGIQPGAMCMLLVDDERIVLYDSSGKSQLAEWYLAALRRYGRTSEYIQFEAGRRCATGEGIFTMITSDGDAIYQQMHVNAQKMAKTHGASPATRQRGSSTSSGVSLGSSSLSRTTSPNGAAFSSSSLPPGMGLQNSSSSSVSKPQSDYAPLTSLTIDKTVYAPLDSAKPKQESTYQELIGNQEQSLYVGVAGSSAASKPENAYEGLAMKHEAPQYADVGMGVPAKPSAGGNSAAVYDTISEGKSSGGAAPAVYQALDPVGAQAGKSSKAEAENYASLSTGTKEKSIYQALG